MKPLEFISRKAPGATTCLGCMGKGYHEVRMPSRYGNGMTNHRPVCPKCNGTGAVMGDRPKAELAHVA